MKATFDKGELQRRLADIQSVVDKKNTMPILNHFLLTAQKDRTFIIATDLETAFKEPVECKVLEEGGVCIPAKKLFEIVKEIEGEITLETMDSQWLQVKCGKSRFRLACLPDKDFPVWPTLEDTEQLTIDAVTLREMIDRSIYAAGESDSRYVLNGLLFHLKPEKTLNIVGTDGHRLALYRREMGKTFSAERKVILSRKAVSELRRFLHDEGQEVKLIIGKNHVQFITGEIHFLTRMIEGTYPNYEQVIPLQNEKTLMIEREALMSLLRRVSVMSREKNNAVKVDLDASSIVVTASNPDLGEAKDEAAADYSGDAMTIAFNAKFLLDVLNVMESDIVILKLQEPLSAVLVLEEGREDYRCVVMPMRT
jgi:DNA polymerase-3 subunit beta